MPAALVDDEWIEMSGGPWTARLMRKARQTAAPPGYRVFGVNVTFGPATPIYSGGAVKFMDVPGGPEQGIICSTSTVPAAAAPQQLMFSLILSEEGAPESSVTIPRVLYRRQAADEDSDGEGGSGDAMVEVDAINAAIRSNHLELNGPPLPASLAPLAAAARETR